MYLPTKGAMRSYEFPRGTIAMTETMRRITGKHAGLEPEFAALLKLWGSEEAIYQFLDGEATRINVVCFEGELTYPAFLIKPNWLSRGLFGDRHSAADYEPVQEDRPPQIGIFTNTLLSKRIAKKAIAHEMIHHWEQTLGSADTVYRYPKEVNKLIRKEFSNPTREKVWRNAHSTLFIAKALEVAKRLGQPAEELLYG